MRKILLALLLVGGLAAVAQAGDWNSEGPRPVRFAALQNMLAPPAGATYSLGGYAPADPNMDPNANSGLIDKGEYASPPGAGCGCQTGGCNLWDGYQARPCHHQHHFGAGRGWSRGCGQSCGGCNSCNTCGGAGLGGCGYGSYGSGYGCGSYGYGYGSYGYGGYGGYGGGCGYASPCAPVCRQRHHCPLFGCHRRSNCCDVATTCDSCGATGCGCGATDGATEMMQPMPTNDSAPRPAPEMLEPAPAPSAAPAPAPGPSARQPRQWRQMTANGGAFGS